MKLFSKKLLRKSDTLSDPEIPYEQVENRGDKEITKFDPEFDFLKKLVNLVGKVAPEAIPDIKALSQQHPFVTINDAGDLAEIGRAHV